MRARDTCVLLSVKAQVPAASVSIGRLPTTTYRLENSGSFGSRRRGIFGTGPSRRNPIFMTSMIKGNKLLVICKYDVNSNIMLVIVY
jgi:hypothetical protein